jgi:sugar (pentulose or hexulose) kinase
MTRVGDMFEPDRRAHAIYDQLYNEIYLKMYGKLRPLYQAMRKM